MWWLLKILLVVVVVAVFVYVALTNDEATASVHLFGRDLVDVPVFLLVFGSAAAGLVAGLSFTAVRELQWRWRVRSSEREKGELRREVQHLRKAPLAALDETPVVGEAAPKSH